MTTVRYDLIDLLDEEERRALLHQTLSLYEEGPPETFGERIEQLLITRGLLTFEDAEDDEGTLL